MGTKYRRSSHINPNLLHSVSRLAGDGLDDCRIGGVRTDMTQQYDLNMWVLHSRVGNKLR